MNRDLSGGRIRLYLDLAVVEWKRMTERDELAGSFCAHHAGDDRALKNRAFFRRDLSIAQEGRELGGQRDKSNGMRAPAGHGLVAHIDHRRPILRIEVRK